MTPSERHADYENAARAFKVEFSEGDEFSYLGVQFVVLFVPPVGVPDSVFTPASVTAYFEDFETFLGDKRLHAECLLGNEFHRRAFRIEQLPAMHKLGG